METEATHPAKLRWQTATIRAIERRTPRVSSFFFVLAEPFGFRAGQHVDVRLTAPDGYQTERSYSIASAPRSSDGIELAIEKLDDGEVSPFFHDVAAVGDAIELRGPIGGHFVWTTEDGGPLLLIGGGSGVAPLMSMIRYRVEVGSQEPTLLVFSARTWQDLIFREELLELERRGDGLHVTFTSTREVARRPADRSQRVDAALLRELLTRLPAAPKHCFVCGANPFVEAATDALLANGIAAGSIRTERYGQ